MRRWSEEILFGSNGSYRALVQDGKEIVNVDCLDVRFVEMIIDAHNKAISETMEESMYKGAEIAKGVYAKKSK